MNQFTDVCLITGDVLRLRRFYESVFGVKSEGDEFHASISLGGLALTFDSVKPLRENPFFGYVSEKSSKNTIISFQTDDVDLEYERLKSLGVELLNEPTTHPWGARSFQFTDPDGNVLNFRTA